jgi:hypothetical protein
MPWNADLHRRELREPFKDDGPVLGERSEGLLRPEDTAHLLGHDVHLGGAGQEDAAEGDGIDVPVVVVKLGLPCRLEQFILDGKENSQ